jgi:hypothetical protein
MRKDCNTPQLQSHLSLGEDWKNNFSAMPAMPPPKKKGIAFLLQPVWV